MKKLISLLLVAFCACGSIQAQKATLRIDAQTKHQHITGFGGFVCSPQFGYNHMSQAEIKKVWGNGSTVGCNIMRLYIPIGKSWWNQSLQTAKWAKQMGLIVFASPWGQPAEWKTNGTSNAKNEDGTTGKLKRENWADYAQYLEEYVQYLRTNGVELDAISIQNEPDWAASYAGCLWSASEIAEFVKLYGRTISCKIMAPETLAVNDSYVNELNKSDVLPCFDIYGGHQYGGIQDGYKKLATQGKEIWMTEYLINWNENSNTSRNFDYSKDVFNFFRSINTCMLGDFNAWIHYAAKRYYGMLGDGQSGTTNGSVTKRGYVMAHFARYVTGMTRVEGQFTDNASTQLEGSVYLSQTGDTVVAVIANPSSDKRTLTLDLPFYTLKGEIRTTTKAQSFKQTILNQEVETCRPEVEIEASSVCTILFERSRDRQVSDMKATVARFGKIDNLMRTNTALGTQYQMSGKTKTLDHSNPLISTKTNAASGYLILSDRFDQLVLQVKKLSSTMNYSSSKTTLYYINAKGTLSSHNYGSIEFGQRENFNWVFDLSPRTLKDGCKGLISITNDNWSSILTFTFGDVYLTNGGGQYAATMSGTFVADDGYLIDYTTDASCTSLDLTGVSSLPATLDWGVTNRVIYLPEGSAVGGDNVVVGDVCANLVLSSDGGDFRPSKAFNATKASFTCMVDGYRMLKLPFKAALPLGVKAYSVASDFSLQALDSVPAHQPVLIEAQGEVVLEGTGEVAFRISPYADMLRGSYTQSSLYEGDYLLGCQDGKWGFIRQTSDGVLMPFDVYANISSTSAFIPLDMSVTGIEEVTLPAVRPDAPMFNVMGQRVDADYKGIVIVEGKKIITK